MTPKLNGLNKHWWSYRFCRSDIQEWLCWWYFWVMVLLTGFLSSLQSDDLLWPRTFEGISEAWCTSTVAHHTPDILQLAIGRKLHFYPTWTSSEGCLTVLMTRHLAFPRASDSTGGGKEASVPFVTKSRQSQAALSAMSPCLHTSSVECVSGEERPSQEVWILVPFEAWLPWGATLSLRGAICPRVNNYSRAEWGKTTRRRGRFSASGRKAVLANKEMLCVRGASDGDLDKNVQKRQNWKKDNMRWGETNAENGESNSCEFRIKPVYPTSRDALHKVYNLTCNPCLLNWGLHLKTLWLSSYPQ